MELREEVLTVTDECESIDCEDCPKKENCEPYKKGVNDLAFL